MQKHAPPIQHVGSSHKSITLAADQCEIIDLVSSDDDTETDRWTATVGVTSGPSPHGTRRDKHNNNADIVSTPPKTVKRLTGIKQEGSVTALVLLK